MYYFHKIKGYLNIKCGIQDVVRVPLWADSDPPTMRAQHLLHLQVSSHLKKPWLIISIVHGFKP